MSDAKKRPPREHGRRWQAVRKEVFNRYGDTCWLGSAVTAEPGVWIISCL